MVLWNRTSQERDRSTSSGQAAGLPGCMQVKVIWTLSVKRIDEASCEYTNSVVAHPTQEFMDFIAAHNVSFEDAAAGRQHDGGDHNRRELRCSRLVWNGGRCGGDGDARVCFRLGGLLGLMWMGRYCGMGLKAGSGPRQAVSSLMPCHNFIDRKSVV